MVFVLSDGRTWAARHLPSGPLRPSVRHGTAMFGSASGNSAVSAGLKAGRSAFTAHETDSLKVPSRDSWKGRTGRSGRWEKGACLDLETESGIRWGRLRDSRMSSPL